MAKEKELYQQLRKSFVAYEHDSKAYHDRNLYQIIKLSRKMGSKQMIKYAATEDSSLVSNEAKEAKELLTIFMRNYYETALLLSTIYGSIKLLGEPEFNNKDARDSIEACISFYMDYDGVKNSDILSIISFMKKKGIIQCLTALKYCYTSSGFKELRNLFEKVENEYLSILEVVSALNPFLATYPIEEIA